MENILFLSELVEVDVLDVFVLFVLVRLLLNSLQFVDELVGVFLDFLGKELIRKFEEKGDVIKFLLFLILVIEGDGLLYVFMIFFNIFK